MIVLEHISKTFQSKSNSICALDDVSLHIKSKEIFGIIGYSGAGKSTLLRCINLLEKPTSGVVKVNGKELTSLSEKQLRKERKKIGMIFQHFYLMNRRTVFDNIAFPLIDEKLSKEEIERKVNSLLTLVDLQDKKNAYPSQLSGGQKQRVAIARALANDPRVLLCDEATSALDPQTTKSILRLLQRVNKELGVTIVLITHEMTVVKEICDRVAVMEKGKIVEKGDIISIFSNPLKDITKSFIATSNPFEDIQEVLQDEVYENAYIVKLQYTKSQTKQALISYISRQFALDVSILFGNIELVKQTMIGDLIVNIQGEKENIQKAFAYMEKEGIKVEVLS